MDHPEIINGPPPGFPFHVHQWMCACPYPHVNPVRVPIYQPNVMPQHGIIRQQQPYQQYPQLEHEQHSQYPQFVQQAQYPIYSQIMPNPTMEMMPPQQQCVYPPNTSMNPMNFMNPMEIAGFIGEPETNPIMAQEEARVMPEVDDALFMKFLEEGCTVAEGIVSRHQHRAGFKKLHGLCQKMKTELSQPSTTEINIHSQGVPWVTKDFICAYMRLVSCWNGLSGYLQLRQGSLGSIEQELTDSFRLCYAQWEDNTKDLAEHFVRIFTNLDQNISNRIGYNPIMPVMNMAQYQQPFIPFPIEYPFYSEPLPILLPEKPKCCKKQKVFKSERSSELSKHCGAVKGIQIEFFSTARNVDLHFEKMEERRLLEVKRREKRKELLENNNRLHDQKFNQIVEQSFKTSAREVRVYRRVLQTHNAFSKSCREDTIYELEIVPVEKKESALSLDRDEIEIVEIENNTANDADNSNGSESSSDTLFIPDMPACEFAEGTFNTPEEVVIESPNLEVHEEPKFIKERPVELDGMGDSLAVSPAQPCEWYDVDNVTAVEDGRDSTPESDQYDNTSELDCSPETEHLSPMTKSCSEVYFIFWVLLICWLIFYTIHFFNSDDDDDITEDSLTWQTNSTILTVPTLE